MKNNALTSRLFDRNTATSRQTQRVAKYQRQVDPVDFQEVATDGQQAENARQKEKCQREIHFAFLPEKYEPLENEDVQQVKEERKKKKKERYKKVKKNVGKALHTSWKFLILGLYNFSLAYSTPVTSAFVPRFYTGRGRE